VDKQILAKLKSWVNTKRSWDGYTEYLDALIDQYHLTTDRANDPVDIYRAQGALNLIKKLKTLREEVNANG
jgi:pyruvate carboxylase